MSLNSSQKTANYTATIGTSSSIGSGTKTTAIDNIFYDTRCNLNYGFRPVKTQLITVNTEDDEGNDDSFTVESPIVNESGGSVKHDYLQCEDGRDEIYFYHIWNWEKDLNSSRQQTINRTIRGIKETATTLQSGSTSATTYSYSLVQDTASWNVTLDKVDVGITGVPSDKDINIYIGGTDDNKIFFRYNSNTKTVVKVGDVINGSTVVKVLNFAESLENNIQNNTLCYAEIQGGNAFTADQSYNASLSGASITVVSGKGIRTRSAVVGIYIERDHKLIELTPILYKKSKNTDCQPETLSDSDADYIKGRLILSDNSTPFKDTWFATNPKSDDAKFIFNILLSYFKLVPEREQLKRWLSTKYSNKLEFQNAIINETKNLLKGDKYFELVDTCFNSITANQIKIYDPFAELSNIEEKISNFSTFINECNENNINSPTYSAPALYGSVEKFNEELLKKISGQSSSVQMPDDLYKTVISNSDSLFNRIKQSMSTIQETFSDQVKYNLSNDLTAEAENEGTVSLTKTSFRDILPKLPKIDTLPSNITVDDSKFDIVNLSNIITTQIYSIPRFNFSTISDTSNFNLDVATDSGYLMSVTASAKTLTTTIGFPPVTTTEISVDYGPGGTGLDQGLQPHIIWSMSSGIQSIYDKDFRFRSVEFSDQTSTLATSRGNSFKTDPPSARLTKDILSSDDTIYVNDTSEFLSSGYLMIPKFIRKLEVYGNDNVKPHFIYDGEEIIYYSGKTNISFTGCVRQRFSTTSNFSSSLDPYSRNTGSNSVTTGYQEGNSITQFYNYKLES